MNPEEFLEALKSEKILHHSETVDYSHPWTGKDIRTTETYLRYISKMSILEEVTICSFTYNETEYYHKKMPFSEFQKWLSDCNSDEIIIMSNDFWPKHCF